MADSKWPEVAGVCFVALCACLAILGWPQWSDASSQTAAAWFQAVFSVIAILVSAAIVWWQHNLERQRNREEAIAQQTRAFEPIVGMVSQAQWQLSNLNDAYNGKISANELLDTDVIVDDIEFLLNAIEQVPVHEIPTEFLISYFIDVRRLLFRTLVQLRKAVHVWRDGDNPDLWRDQLPQTTEGYHAMRRMYAIFKDALIVMRAGRRPTLRI
jgi:hypothetical protein